LGSDEKRRMVEPDEGKNDKKTGRMNQFGSGKMDLGWLENEENGKVGKNGSGLVNAVPQTDAANGKRNSKRGGGSIRLSRIERRQCKF
jgi:hypothetical protein